MFRFVYACVHIKVDIIRSDNMFLTLLHSKQPKLHVYGVLAILSAIGLKGTRQGICDTTFD